MQASSFEEPCAGNSEGSMRGQSGNWLFYLDGFWSFRVNIYVGNLPQIDIQMRQGSGLIKNRG